MEVSDVGVGEKGILLIGIEEAEVLHDDGDKEIEDDVGDDDIERAEEENGPVEVTTVSFPYVHTCQEEELEERVKGIREENDRKV